MYFVRNHSHAVGEIKIDEFLLLCLGLLFASVMKTRSHGSPKVLIVSSKGVPIVESKFTFSQESRCHYRRPLRRRMRSKILTSVNAKYHYFYLFVYKISKGELRIPVFCWCEFIDLIVFLAVIA